MLDIALTIASVFVTLALILSMIRLIIGPDMPDRILALDTLYINSIVLLLLLGMHLGSSLYFEVALLIAVIGFVGTVALSNYLLRGNIVD